MCRIDSIFETIDHFVADLIDLQIKHGGMHDVVELHAQFHRDLSPIGFGGFKVPRVTDRFSNSGFFRDTHNAGWKTFPVHGDLVTYDFFERAPFKFQIGLKFVCVARVWVENIGRRAKGKKFRVRGDIRNDVHCLLRG